VVRETAGIAQLLEEHRRIGARPMDGRPRGAVASLEWTLGDVWFCQMSQVIVSCRPRHGHLPARAVLRCQRVLRHESDLWSNEFE